MKEIIVVKRPIVARETRQMPIATVAIVFALFGVGVFSWLSEARATQEQRSSALPPLPGNASTPAPADAPATGAVSSTQLPPAGPAYFDPNSAPPVKLQTNSSAPVRDFSGALSAGRQPLPGNEGTRARLNAPTLIVDLAQIDQRSSTLVAQQGRAVDERGVTSNTTTTTIAATPGGGIVAGSTTTQDRGLSDVEQFSERVGNSEIEVARASRMTGLDRLVPQGAVIGGVMETALNSDLPGFARAITQRSVYSFDGSEILIPAGSRLIGQYKSGIAQGASRIFILWTRLIRPDGVSIELASPATDELGRGGLAGKVNRHFLQRFGGAILTSVLTGGISAAIAGLSGGSTILVSSANQASALADQAKQGNDIPPTITTRQGAPVRIFVARDLDFSAVGPAR